MDTMQPWNQMPQGYRAGQGYFPPRPFNKAQTPGQQGPPLTDTSQQMEWLSGLSREEKLEAKRLAEQAMFSFEGYQVVRREFISHQFDPAMTIRGTSITFNNSCISKLEDATYIHFLINPMKKRLLIRSVNEGTRDAVRWCVVKGDKRKSRQISCKRFTARLYEMLKWEPEYRYKLQGMKINYEGEDMYLFDLTSVEGFLPQHRDPQTGKVSKAEAVLPEEWGSSYGMSVEEHAASTMVDLSSGYTPVKLDEPDANWQSTEEYEDEEMPSPEEEAHI